MSVSKERIKSMINIWQAEVDSIKDFLFMKGGESYSIDYNLSSCRALCLLECINHATLLLVEDNNL